MKAVEASSLVTGWSSGKTNWDMKLMVLRGETVTDGCDSLLVSMWWC